MSKRVNYLIMVFFISCLGLYLIPVIGKAEIIKYETIVKDSDYDGLSDQAEIQIYKTDPQKADTDSDGFLDAAEVLASTSPLIANVATPSATPTLVATNANSASSWPWYISRASAITAYILLFILILSGAGVKTSFIFRFTSPTTAWINHRLLGIAMAASVALHVTSLYFDNHKQFSLVSLLIPFASDFQPLFVAFGIFAFYLLLFIIISSIFYIDKYQKQWRLIHYLTYPLFILATIHGFFIGSDSSSTLMRTIYPVFGTIFALIIFYRLYFFWKQVR